MENTKTHERTSIDAQLFARLTDYPAHVEEDGTRVRMVPPPVYAREKRRLQRAAHQEKQTQKRRIQRAAATQARRAQAQRKARAK